VRAPDLLHRWVQQTTRPHRARGGALQTLDRPPALSTLNHRMKPGLWSSSAFIAGAFFQWPPCSRLDKARPVVGVVSLRVSEHLELRSAQRFTAARSGEQLRVEADHEIASTRVRHRPKRHHRRLGSGEHQRSSKAVYPVTVPDLPYARVAGREHDELRPPEIEPGHLERRQNPDFARATQSSVGARQ
jgi:hypothetical protein